MIHESETICQTGRGKIGIMNEYLIYTAEGFTESLENNEVENCQLLGRIQAEDNEQAKDCLKKDNPLIEEIGFDIDSAFVQQVLSEKNRQDLKRPLNYLWKDEERHFEESVFPQDHIFRTMSRLNILC